MQRPSEASRPLHHYVEVHAETLRLLPVELPLLELLEEPSSRFTTICSLLFGFRLNVTCCGFDP
jgi:hypothetical protein